MPRKTFIAEEIIAKLRRSVFALPSISLKNVRFACCLAACRTNPAEMR